MDDFCEASVENYLSRSVCGVPGEPGVVFLTLFGGKHTLKRSWLPRLKDPGSFLEHGLLDLCSDKLDVGILINRG